MCCASAGHGFRGRWGGPGEPPSPPAGTEREVRSATTVGGTAAAEPAGLPAPPAVFCAPVGVRSGHSKNIER